jgi:hypothetical protein
MGPKERRWRKDPSPSQLEEMDRKGPSKTLSVYRHRWEMGLIVILRRKMQSGHFFPWACTGTLWRGSLDWPACKLPIQPCLFLNLHTSDLKMEVACCSETSISPINYMLSQPRGPHSWQSALTSISGKEYESCNFLGPQHPVLIHPQSIYSALNLRNEAHAYKTAGKITLSKQQTGRFQIISAATTLSVSTSQVARRHIQEIPTCHTEISFHSCFLVLLQWSWNVHITVLYP